MTPSEKPKKEYRLIISKARPNEAAAAAEFQMQITQLLNEGWTLHGHTFISPHAPYICQAMVYGAN